MGKGDLLKGLWKSAPKKPVHIPHRGTQHIPLKPAGTHNAPHETPHTTVHNHGPSGGSSNTGLLIKGAGGAVAYGMVRHDVEAIFSQMGNGASMLGDSANQAFGALKGELASLLHGAPSLSSLSGGGPFSTAIALTGLVGGAYVVYEIHRYF